MNEDNRSAVYWRVAVPVPLRRQFDYLPAANADGARPGCRVAVSFGRQQLVGVLLELATTTSVPVRKLRAATALIDRQPLLSATDLRLLSWAAAYYQQPPGEVFAAALPPGNPAALPGPPPPRFLLSLTAAGRSAQPAPRATRQHAVLDLLREAVDDLDEALVRDRSGASAAVLKALLDRGWVQRREAPADAGQAVPVAGPDLNAHQHRCVEHIIDDLGRFATHLIYGVTGSGKTEIYLQVAAAALAAGQQVLLLAPEIGLTPQLAERARERLPGRHVVLHSGLPTATRQRGWLAAATGVADVIIGTRSAVFCPMPKLGLIVIDEEHDLSFKQQEGFRYSARDVAVRRAQVAAVPVVLGSATPTLESIANAERGRYRQHRLNERAGGGQLAPISLVNGAPAGRALAAPVLAAMADILAAGRQVLLFLNRRGFAPVLVCPECQWQAACQRCDARLVLHQQAGVLRCHHCGHQQRTAPRCPDCGAAPIAVGAGTERVEGQVRRQFPDTPVLRLDRDTTRRRGELEAALSEARRRGPRILIGTQMLAKGHDFRDVGLAVVLSVDSALFAVDFRAAERLAQLVIQVAGRAGRGREPGRVLLQTGFVDHPLLQQIARHDHNALTGQLLEERRDLGLPPFTYQLALYAEAPTREAVQAFLDAALRCLQRPDALEVFGPIPALRERIADRFRWQLLLQSADRALLQTSATAWLAKLEALPAAAKLRWSVDVDPQAVF